MEQDWKRGKNPSKSQAVGCLLRRRRAERNGSGGGGSDFPNLSIPSRAEPAWGHGGSSPLPPRGGEKGKEEEEEGLKGIKSVAKVSYVRVLVSTLFLVYDATNHVDDSSLIRAAAALYVDACTGSARHILSVGIALFFVG